MEGVKMAPFAAMTQPIIEGMGAVPVQLPITEVYTGLSTGTVDAASVSISNLTPPWNFWDVTTHMHDNMPVPFAVLFVVMNKERYEGLSDEHRAIIDGLSGRDFSMRGAESFDLADQESLDAMEANPDAWTSMERVTVSDAARAEMDAATQAGLEVIFSDYEGRGIENAADIYNALNQ
jgi:TRAP-type C4-dicarboxylate transport system substrate-binding protein